MNHIRNRLVLAGAILALALSVAEAQTAPPSSSTPGPLGAQGAPPPMTANLPQEKVMDGPVKRVDPLARTISVGWLLGFASTTLEVTDDTRIAVEGTTGSLQDIREGDEVKAAYEARDGKNIAKSIEVTEAEPEPQRVPAPSGPPPLGPPQGSEAPVPPAPKTLY